MIISVGAHLRTVTMSSLKPYLILSPDEACAFKATRFRAAEIEFRATSPSKFPVSREAGAGGRTSFRGGHGGWVGFPGLGRPLRWRCLPPSGADRRVLGLEWSCGRRQGAAVGRSSPATAIARGTPGRSGDPQSRRPASSIATACKDISGVIRAIVNSYPTPTARRPRPGQRTAVARIRNTCSRHSGEATGRPADTPALAMLPKAMERAQAGVQCDINVGTVMD
jgi:hypothetical protein